MEQLFVRIKKGCHRAHIVWHLFTYLTVFVQSKQDQIVEIEKNEDEKTGHSQTEQCLAFKPSFDFNNDSLWRPTEKLVHYKNWFQSGIVQIFDGNVTMQDALLMLKFDFEPSSICLMASLGAEKALKGAFLFGPSKNLNRPSLYLKHKLGPLCQSVFPDDVELQQMAEAIDNLGQGASAIVASRYPQVKNTYKTKNISPFDIVALPSLNYSLEMASHCVLYSQRIVEKCQILALEMIYGYNKLGIPVDFSEHNNAGKVPFNFSIFIKDGYAQMRLFRKDFSRPCLIQHKIDKCCLRHYLRMTSADYHQYV